MASHIIKSVFRGGMVFETDIDSHTVKTDLKNDDGGLDSAPGPKKLMLVALAGCTGVDVVAILNKMRVTFSDLSIETHAQLSEGEPKIYTAVEVVYAVKVAEKDHASVEKAVKLSSEKYCGVMAMFRSFAEVKTSISFL